MNVRNAPGSPAVAGAAPPRVRWGFWIARASVVWTVPLWLIRFPPMVDYPQQLAAAAIIRWYHDPARALEQAYELVLWRPHGLFELLTAGLGWLLPVDIAGKVVVSLSLAAVPPSAAPLCPPPPRPACVPAS